jgi:hypothetical protein
MAKKKTIDYTPLTEEQFIKLKADLITIKDYLPTNLMGEFWGLCNTIRGERTPQPCSCKSSAKHWGACVETLNTFIKERE